MTRVPREPAGLYPTPSRLALLQAVNAGDVVEGPDEHGTVWTWLIDPPYVPRRVQARMQQLKAAGWVELIDMRWHLTTAGGAVLDGAS